MDENGPHVEHIESREIKKLINLLHSSRPEDIVEEPVQNHIDNYQGLVQHIEHIMPKKSNENHYRSDQESK